MASYHEKVLHNYFIPYLKNAVANAVNAAHDNKAVIPFRKQS